MKNQTEITKLFFELLQIVVGTRQSLSRIPSVKGWQRLYEMATKQSLVGVCFAGVQQLCDSDSENYCGMTEMQYLMWMGMAAKIQQRNHNVDARCVELQRIISDAGYRNCIFKGQAVATLYSQGGASCGATSLALLRQSGDIDVWIEGGKNRVIEFVEQIAPTREVRETHVQMAVFDDVEVEAHYRPGLIRDFVRNRRLQKFFADCAEACFTNEITLSCGTITAPTQRFNAIHQILHIYHHLFDGGIGLRQVMDYYFVLCNLPESEKPDVMRMLKSLGVKRFVAAVMYVLQEVFGLSEQLMLCAPNERDGQFLLNEILQAGNFGQHDERNKKFDMGSYSQNFWGIIGRNFAYVRFAPWDWLMSPLWRIYHFAWRKLNGYV